jgi:hypothetical protein
MIINSNNVCGWGKRPANLGDPRLIDHADDCTERRLDELKFAEQFVVWAFRAWVHNSQRSSHKAVAIETGFRLAKIEPALATLNFFMRIVQNTASRPIEVRCIQCPTLAPDEELLIHAVGALQAGRHATAHMILHHYLPCAAVRASAGTLEDFAERLLAGGLLVQPSEAGRTHLEAMAMDVALPSMSLH